MSRLWPIVDGRRVPWEQLTGIPNPADAPIAFLRAAARSALAVDEQIEAVEIERDGKVVEEVERV
ncbi:MAG TPA: hypothetical protein VNE39_18405 [Planctomycetota bacterium]|nr:hypothetical protein [Planctomycetota bacterium]